jgi:hypothetical protein
MAATGLKSKKRSGANSRKQPESLVFFIDRALGNKKIAEALRGAGASVRVHNEHFAPAERDDIWLPEIGRRGWVLLTKDSRIRYRTKEREALINARVRAFILISGNLSGPDMADILVKALPRIRRFVESHFPPFIAKIYKGGSVRMWFSPQSRVEQGDKRPH